MAVLVRMRFGCSLLVLSDPRWPSRVLVSHRGIDASSQLVSYLTYRLPDLERPCRGKGALTESRYMT